MLSPDEHGVEVTITEPVEGAEPFTVHGLFEAVATSPDLVEGPAHLSSQRFTLTCRRIDVRRVEQDWHVDVPGEPPFKVVDRRPGDPGLVEFILHKR